MKTALVTGASSATGQAIVLALAEGGFNIAAHYCRHAEPVQAIQAQAASLGVAIDLFGFDLTDAVQAGEMVKAVASRFGGIDVLVNTVGPFYSQDILSVTPAAWAEAIAANLHTAFNVTYFAREYLCASKGHIVNFAFAGVENLSARSTSAAYCAAKAGIVILTKSLAAGLAPLGVRVNAVCPGLIDEGQVLSEERQAMAQGIPVGRLGSPAEVAHVVKWLVTESPAYVTGALVPVAGAWEY